MKKYHLFVVADDGKQQYENIVEISSGNIAELDQKLIALEILSKSLSHEDFVTTVELINEKPELIPLLKELINEGEKLTETQLMMKVPGYVKRVMNVLKS